MVAEENDVDFESMVDSGGDVDFAEDIDFEVEEEAKPARRSRGTVVGAVVAMMKLKHPRRSW